jgi:hypothetical protein
MFFTNDPDPTEMASILVGAAIDCVPTGNARLDVFVADLADRYRALGGFAAFDGNAVEMCEDAALALEMVAAQAESEDARELAQMNLMAYAEARGSDAWTAGGEDVEWADASELAAAWYD